MRVKIDTAHLLPIHDDCDLIKCKRGSWCRKRCILYLRQRQQLACFLNIFFKETILEQWYNLQEFTRLENWISPIITYTSTVYAWLSWEAWQYILNYTNISLSKIIFFTWNKKEFHNNIYIMYLILASCQRNISHSLSNGNSHCVP